MADENISIEIADKVSPSISNKLVKIAENARAAVMVRDLTAAGRGGRVGA